MYQFNKDQGYRRSNKYVPVNTEEVLKNFTDAGYIVRSVSAARVINPDKAGFQKHLIRLQHPNLVLNDQGLKPEIVLKNSFDGSCAFTLSLGIYRLICANGLEVGTTFQRERVIHIGNDVLGKVLIAAETIKDQLPDMSRQVEALKSVELTIDQQYEYASTIAEMLLVNRPEVTSINPDDLLRPRRLADDRQDAFTILNVIQENALKGNFFYTTEVKSELDPNNMVVIQHKFKRVTSIDKTSEVNQLVWDKGLKLINY